MCAREGLLLVEGDWGRVRYVEGTPVCDVHAGS